VTQGGARESLDARVVVLAPGTRPCALGIPGEAELTGSAVFHEVRDLLSVLPRPREVIVVGGGEAALDYALTLCAAGAAVRILVRGARPCAAARLAEVVAARKTIEVRTGVLPTLIRRTESGIRLEVGGADPAAFAADALLVAVGRESRVDEILTGPPRGDGELAPAGFPDLYVVGDARLGRLGQAGIAVGDGLAAAMRAARLP
jgi:thioredoxin reductase